MGSCLSKTKRGANTLESVPEGQLQRPSNQHRRSITYIKPRAPCDNEESLKRFNVMEEAEELELGGLKIRYGYMSQRGYYPGGELDYFFPREVCPCFSFKDILFCTFGSHLAWSFFNLHRFEFD